MTTKGYQRFGQLINKQKISRIVATEETVVDTYTKWEKEVMSIKTQCEQNPRTKQITRKQKILMRAKRKIKKSKDKAKPTEAKRRRLLTEHIEREIMNKRATKIRETIESIRKNGGGVKEDTFWEFRRRITGRSEEIPHKMKDRKGELRRGAGKQLGWYRRLLEII